MIKNRPIEIFAGTGGVGKTTLATGRALFLASKGHKVLLITIDPIKRLKQILKMEDSDSGSVASIDSHLFGQYDKEFSFDALLMDPSRTLRRVTQENNTFKDFDNHIIDILTRPYGGMNEIMAIIEVQYQLNTKKYDTIVLDTPPGKHFIDFLNSTQKIKRFFDKNFVEVFKYLGKSFSKDSKEKTGVLSLFVKTGIKKLLGYLEKVTGETFLEEFIDAVSGLYRNKDIFLEALNFQQGLEDEGFCNWFLVTSVEQQKMLEASDLQREVQEVAQHNNYLIINKCLGPYLAQWNPSSEDPLFKLRESMLERENRIKRLSENEYKDTLEFSEVLESSPTQHVAKLALKWGDHQG